MGWQHTVYAYPILFATLVAVVLAIYTVAVIRREGIDAILGSFLVITVCLALWTGFSALKLLSTDTTTKLLFYRSLYFGVAPLSPTVLVFALAYTDRRNWIRPAVVAGLFAVPVLFWILLWTNPAELVWGDPTIYEVDGLLADQLTVMRLEDGPAHDILVGLYSAVVAVAALVVVCFEAIRLGRTYLTQAVLVGIAALAPLVFTLFSLVQIPPFQNDSVNLIPTSALVTASVLAVAVFRYKVFRLPPLAYTSAIRESPDGVVVLDAEERIVQTNEKAKDLLDTLGTTAGEKLTGAVPSIDLSADGETTIEVDDTGSTVFYNVRTRSLERAGRTVGWVVVFRNITAEKRQQRQLREQTQQLERQNERLDRFASLVSHDLRNPLGIANGRLELLAEETDSEHIDSIRSAHERMEDIIDQMLLIARADTERTETSEQPLADLATAAWATTETEDGQLEIQVPDQYHIDCDREMVQHIFENLFRNAILHNDGPVTVTVGRWAQGFYIEDDGSGIDREQRETVFEYGETSTADGFGLGLTVVDDLVAAHSWEIAIGESDAGGARFEITTEPRATDSEDVPATR